MKKTTHDLNDEKNWKSVLHQLQVGSKEDAIDCENNSQMIADDLRKPNITFLCITKQIGEKQVIIGREYVVKTDAEKTILANIPKAVKNYKFENKQSFNCSDKVIYELKIHVKNTGLRKGESHNDTPKHKRSNFFKTTYVFNCAESDIRTTIKKFVEKEKLEVTKVFYNHTIYNFNI